MSKSFQFVGLLCQCPLRNPLVNTPSKLLNQLKRRRSIDVVSVHLPLVSWTRKQFRYIEENIAPVVSTLHGSWVGEREGVRRAALNREAATPGGTRTTSLFVLQQAGTLATSEQVFSNRHAALRSRVQRKKSFMNSTRFQTIRISKSFTTDATHESLDRQTRIMKGNNSLTNEFVKSMVVQMKKHSTTIQRQRHQ